MCVIKKFPRTNSSRARNSSAANIYGNNGEAIEINFVSLSCFALNVDLWALCLPMGYVTTNMIENVISVFVIHQSI